MQVTEARERALQWLTKLTAVCSEHWTQLMLYLEGRNGDGFKKSYKQNYTILLQACPTCCPQAVCPRTAVNAAQWKVINLLK